MPADSQIVFALDVWEHAYMLDFTPAQKADYVKTVLDNVDWAVVEQRFASVETREAAHA
jgi:Fe-Mn family superoxide dismutase